MKFHVRTGDPLSYTDPLLVVPVSEFKGGLPRQLKLHDEAVGGQLAAATRDFAGKSGQNLLCYTADGKGRVLFTGLGSKAGSDPDAYRRAMGRAGSRAQRLKCDRLALQAPDGRNLEVATQAAVEGVRLGAYVYNRYQTLDPSPSTLKEVSVICSSRSRAKVQRAVQRGAIIGRGAVAVRDMVSTPAADWTPDHFAREARALGRECGFRVEVKSPPQLKKEGFGGLLAVGGGSANTPRFIRMDYMKGRGKPVVLLGKGITFDTGGISLKPGAEMDLMKGDMGGAGVVLATMATVARLGMKINLIGLICSAENMPSGTAYRPGDIVTVYGGKTIEVLNTDAEGRIVLADGLSYARKLDPRMVIDLATLTGAVIIALGYHTAGTFGTDEKMIQGLSWSGKITAERVWNLPLEQEHTELVKSQIADVKNSTGRPAASSAAAAFLRTFTDDKYPWVHMDIAGVDHEYKGTDYIPKGATGFGLRLLVDFLSRL